MQTEEGLKWFLSTEPYGASHGIFKIFACCGEKENIHITVFENNHIVSDSTYEAAIVF
jgi:hypothetical protein